MSRNIIIAQARTTSTRLPGKIFKKLLGKPAIFHFLDACFEAETIDKVILAVPDSQKKEFRFLTEEYPDILVFGGDEEDVLSRFAKAAEMFEPKNIVRLTSDCFLMQYEVIDECVRMFSESNVDYLTNYNLKCSEDDPDNYESLTETPDGFCVEVFSCNALKDAHVNAVEKYDREHVTPWIKRNKKCVAKSSGRLLLSGKLSVDTEEDFKIVEAALALFKKDRIKVDL